MAIRFIVFTFLALISGTALGQSSHGAISAPDPYILNDNAGSFGPNNLTFKDTNTKTLRSSVINTGIRNLVLITAGQSQWTTINPTAFVPTNASVVDNFNVYDGADYNLTGILLGCQNNPVLAGSDGGPGNLSGRVADALVTAGKFDRVIVIPLAIGSTSITDWTTGVLVNRIAVAMKRLAARGMTPATTGVTFALIWGQGETDGVNGMTSAVWQSNFATFKANAIAAGFSGRIFVVEETQNGGTQFPVIQGAQAAVVDNVTVFAGGNMDSLSNADRQASETHLNDAGAAAFTTLAIAAMHASGAPY